MFHTNEYAGYVQDDWKLLPRLTINLGLRYDYQQMPKAKIPNPNIPVTAGMPDDRNNFSPRFGFAWDVFGKGKTVVHGGIGVYYGRIQNGHIYSALATTGASAAQFSLSTSASATSPLYPNLISTTAPPAVSNIVAFRPGFQSPLSAQVDLSIQQYLGYKTVLGVAYLGAFGKNLPTFVDANIAPATTTKTYTFSGGPLAGSLWTVPVYTARLNSAYNALTLLSSSLSSNYNALAVTLEHRLTQGVQLSANYTWSKSLDYGTNQGTTSSVNSQTDPFTDKPDYGIGTNDIPQRFTANLIIQPQFKIENRYARLAANGWTLAPVWTWQSGMPFSYGLTGGTSIAGGGATCNGSGGSAVSVATNGSSEYVNFRAYPQLSSSFTGPAAVSRDSVRGTTINDVDVRLSRGFSFHEKYKLTLSGEAFNIANREQFTAFNYTAYSLSGATATYQASFGTPSAAGNTVYRERQIQFIGRFGF